MKNSTDRTRSTPTSILNLLADLIMSRREAPITLGMPKNECVCLVCLVCVRNFGDFCGRDMEVWHEKTVLLNLGDLKDRKHVLVTKTS